MRTIGLVKNDYAYAMLYIAAVAVLVVVVVVAVAVIAVVAFVGLDACCSLIEYLCYAIVVIVLGSLHGYTKTKVCSEYCSRSQSQSLTDSLALCLNLFLCLLPA